MNFCLFCFSFLCQNKKLSGCWQMHANALNISNVWSKWILKGESKLSLITTICSPTLWACASFICSLDRFQCYSKPRKSSEEHKMSTKPYTKPVPSHILHTIFSTSSHHILHRFSFLLYSPHLHTFFTDSQSHSFIFTSSEFPHKGQSESTGDGQCHRWLRGNSQLRDVQRSTHLAVLNAFGQRWNSSNQKWIMSINIMK